MPSTLPEDKFSKAVEMVHKIPILSFAWAEGRLDGRHNREMRSPPTPHSKEEPYFVIYLAGFLLGLKERDDFILLRRLDPRSRIERQLLEAGLTEEQVKEDVTLRELVELHIDKLWKNMEQV